MSFALSRPATSTALSAATGLLIQALIFEWASISFVRSHAQAAEPSAQAADVPAVPNPAATDDNGKSYGKIPAGKPPTDAHNSAVAAPTRKSTAKASAPKQPPSKPKMTMSTYLDHLMMAESGGRDHAANSRSSARGAYQFISATFLVVARRHFSDRIANLSIQQILNLRTDRTFARKAAEAYSRDNAAYLVTKGVKPSFTALRLAFLLGPYAAQRVLKAPPGTPLGTVLSRAAMRANPFMARMKTRDIIAKAARDLRLTNPNTAAMSDAPIAQLNLAHASGTTGVGKKQARKPKPQIAVKCNLSRPSCRRWLALQKRKLQRRLVLRQAQ